MVARVPRGTAPLKAPSAQPVWLLGAAVVTGLAAAGLLAFLSTSDRGLVIATPLATGYVVCAGYVYRASRADVRAEAAVAAVGATAAAMLVTAFSIAGAFLPALLLWLCVAAVSVDQALYKNPRMGCWTLVAVGLVGVGIIALFLFFTVILLP